MFNSFGSWHPDEYPLLSSPSFLDLTSQFSAQNADNCLRHAVLQPRKSLSFESTEIMTKNGIDFSNASDFMWEAFAILTSESRLILFGYSAFTGLIHQISAARFLQLNAWNLIKIINIAAIKDLTIMQV